MRRAELAFASLEEDEYMLNQGVADTHVACNRTDQTLSTLFVATVWSASLLSVEHTAVVAQMAFHRLVWILSGLYKYRKRTNWTLGNDPVLGGIILLAFVVVPFPVLLAITLFAMRAFEGEKVYGSA